MCLIRQGPYPRIEALSPAPRAFDHAAPDPGADSDRVLIGFGIAANEFEELRDKGAVY
jgi:crotonobetainyl-CoA:carnitine CoA-transferase CaiB-like acyl-CoA transferase